MGDQDKTKEQLLDELQALRQRLAAQERDAAAPAVRDSERRFQAFLDNGPAIGFMKDETGRYHYVSNNVGRYVGLEPAQMIGKTDADLWLPDQARQIQENDAAVLASGKLVELVETVTGRDGSLQHYLVFKFPFHDGSGKQFLGGVGVEITARKQAEERLSQYAEHFRALSRRLVEVQEEERRRLARELHDEIGQALTSLRFTLEAGRAATGDTAPARLDEARAQIEETLARVRGLSFDLRPALLDHLGLLAALRSLVERYTARTSIRVNFKHAGLDDRLPPEVETPAYRVVQEALTNVARHAGVTDVAVRVWVDAGALHIQIEDEGQGFDPQAVLAAGRSNGLPGMCERVTLQGGQVTIESAPGSGTHLSAQVPLAGQSGRKINEHFHRLGR